MRNNTAYFLSESKNRPSISAEASIYHYFDFLYVLYASISIAPVANMRSDQS